MNIIQAAIDRGEKIIRLPEGVTTVDATIHVPSGTSIRGQGRNHSEVHVTGKFHGFDITDQSDVTFQGFAITYRAKRSEYNTGGAVLQQNRNETDSFIYGFMTSTNWQSPASVAARSGLSRVAESNAQVVAALSVMGFVGRGSLAIISLRLATMPWDSTVYHPGTPWSETRFTVAVLGA